MDWIALGWNGRKYKGNVEGPVTVARSMYPVLVDDFLPFIPSVLSVPTRTTSRTPSIFQRVDYCIMGTGTVQVQKGG